MILHKSSINEIQSTRRSCEFCFTFCALASSLIAFIGVLFSRTIFSETLVLGLQLISILYKMSDSGKLRNFPSSILCLWSLNPSRDTLNFREYLGWGILTTETPADFELFCKKRLIWTRGPGFYVAVLLSSFTKPSSHKDTWVEMLPEPATNSSQILKSNNHQQKITSKSDLHVLSQSHLLM